MSEAPERPTGGEGNERPVPREDAPAPATEEVLDVRDVTGTDGGEPASAAGQDDGTSAGGQDDADELTVVRRELAERTVDLQRLQAEYVNYRRRVDRDRDSVRESGRTAVLTELLPVLDDIGRARQHGELEGAFASIAGALEATVAKLGLIAFGAQGDPFDPMVHEALMHAYSDEVTEATCVQVFQPGYRVGERVVRAARVSVAEPES